jgi:hypothetical protein
VGVFLASILPAGETLVDELVGVVADSWCIGANVLRDGLTAIPSRPWKIMKSRQKETEVWAVEYHVVRDSDDVGTCMSSCGFPFSLSFSVSPSTR